MYVSSKSKKQKNLVKKFVVGLLRSMAKIAGSGAGSISPMHRSVDPDTYQNVTNPQH
jgi:hypothetical protein